MKANEGWKPHEPNFRIHCVLTWPQEDNFKQIEWGTKIVPEKVCDLRTWVFVAKYVALALYRAVSGDTRGEQIGGEFDAIVCDQHK